MFPLCVFIILLFFDVHDKDDNTSLFLLFCFGCDISHVGTPANGNWNILWDYLCSLFGKWLNRAQLQKTLIFCHSTKMFILVTAIFLYSSLCSSFSLCSWPVFVLIDAGNLSIWKLVFGTVLDTAWLLQSPVVKGVIIAGECLTKLKSKWYEKHRASC